MASALRTRTRSATLGGGGVEGGGSARRLQAWAKTSAAAMTAGPERRKGERRVDAFTANKLGLVPCKDSGRSASVRRNLLPRIVGRQRRRGRRAATDDLRGGRKPAIPPRARPDAGWRQGARGPPCHFRTPI